MDTYLRSVDIDDVGAVLAGLVGMGIATPAGWLALDADDRAEVIAGLKDAKVSVGDRSKMKKAHLQVRGGRGTPSRRTR